MKKINICIVTSPMGQASVEPLGNLISIIQALSNKVSIIEVYGKDIRNITILNDKKNQKCCKIIHKSGKNLFSRILRYGWTQLKTSYNMAKLAKNIDLWIFFMGETLIMPMITAKVLRKRVILAMGGFLEKEIDLKGDSIAKISKPFKKVSLTLSNRIILYSPNLIKEWNLEKYKKKILVAHRHFIDFDKFKIKYKFNERENLVGYIGRLSEEKGVLNFVKAIPEILKERNKIRFLIGGDGQLRDKIEKYLDEKDLNDKVKLVGWIPHDELPDYLNELKLVVLPSYTEGLPNLMLEAMACGTPVLATPVGAIPDVIKDEETGFILENNSPECIAKNVERALNHPNLEEIVKTARKLVEKEFTYEATVERYKAILSSLVNIK